MTHDGQATITLARGAVALPEPLASVALRLRYQRLQATGKEGWLLAGRKAGTHLTAERLRGPPQALRHHQPTTIPSTGLSSSTSLSSFISDPSGIRLITFAVIWTARAFWPARVAGRKGHTRADHGLRRSGS